MSSTRSKSKKQVFSSQSSDMRSPSSVLPPLNCTGKERKNALLKREGKVKSTPDIMQAVQPVFPGLMEAKDCLTPSNTVINHDRGTITGVVSIAPGSGVKCSVSKRLDGYPSSRDNPNSIVLPHSPLVSPRMGFAVGTSSASAKDVETQTPTFWDLGTDTVKLLELVKITLFSLVQGMKEHQTALTDLNLKLNSHISSDNKATESLLDHGVHGMTMLKDLDGKLLYLANLLAENKHRLLELEKRLEPQSACMPHVSVNSVVSDEGDIDHGELFTSPLLPSVPLESEAAHFNDPVTLEFTPLFYQEDGYGTHSFNTKVFLTICKSNWQLRSVLRSDITKICYLPNSDSTITARLHFISADLRNHIWASRDHFLCRGIDIRSRFHEGRVGSNESGVRQTVRSQTSLVGLPLITGAPEVGAILVPPAPVHNAPGGNGELPLLPPPCVSSSSCMKSSSESPISVEGDLHPLSLLATGEKDFRAIGGVETCLGDFGTSGDLG